MQGRYGVDQLSKFLLVLGLIAVVVSSVLVDNIAGLIFYILGWALVIYCYFRVFSRNIQKRYAENGADDIGQGPVYIRRSDAEEALLAKQGEMK